MIRAEGLVRRAVILLLTLSLAISRLTFANGAPPRPAPRLVLVYATCSVNKNYLSPYNARVGYTPNLQAFAKNARVFARHQTEEGQSAIAFASLWTGTQAMLHGIYRYPEPLDKSNYLMAQAFAEQGYETYFWDEHSMASASLNYGQGVSAEHVTPHMLKVDDSAFAKLLERLQKDKNLRVFVMTNHTVTHRTYTTGSLEEFCARYPAECRGTTVEERKKFSQLFDDEDVDLSYNFEATVARRKLSSSDKQTLISVIEARYKSCVARLDSLFGDVVGAVEKAGLFDQSLIVFTSDHGEVLYRANVPFKWTHGFMLAPEDLSIPLIIHAPGVSGGQYQHVTRSIDVFPTVAALAGIQVSRKHALMGVDLSPALLNKEAERSLIAYSHTALVPAVFLQQSMTLPPFHRLFPRVDINGMWVAARAGDFVYKLKIIDGRSLFEVYNWGTDPEERRNLFHATSHHQRVMFNRLRQYKESLVTAYVNLPPGRRTLTDKESADRLRSLGYMH